MQKTKHHFIPRFILKNFARNNHIYMYRHDNHTVFCPSINDAFAVNDLNTLKDKSGNVYKNLIEDLYDQHFENNAAISIQKIIDDFKQPHPNVKDFTINDHINVLRFCILSDFRVPYSLEKSLHMLQVSFLAPIFIKWFTLHSNLDLPFDMVEMPKGMLYEFLNDFDRSTKLLADLKLTIFTHKFEDEFFIIPDQYVIIDSPNNCKFSDKQLKMFFPVSSNIIICFERLERQFSKGLCYISKQQVNDFNRYFANNTFESFGCQDGPYLSKFLENNTEILVPLRRFNPYTDFTDEKVQIKSEIILKQSIIRNSDSIITSIDRNHEFKILTEDEFGKIQREMDPLYKIRTNKINL
jgi:hypothetical protein